jgi:GNAT superfamily N-acetyltransferase
MPARDLVIRPVGNGDRTAWEQLWHAYLDFYEASQMMEATDITWGRIHDPDEPMFALGAYSGGRMVGIVHYLFHRSFWTPGDYCYLQDLFVAPDARIRGAGRALIEAVEGKAREWGASRLYWLTKETNQTARALYDKVADRSGFIQYRKLF